MVQNMAIPYIEAKESKDENLHAFEIVNIEWVLENLMLRKLVISEAERMTTKYFLRHGLPFRYNPVTGNPERISPIR